MGIQVQSADDLEVKSKSENATLQEEFEQLNKEPEITIELKETFTEIPVNKESYKLQFIWHNIIALLMLHLVMLYGFVLIPTVHDATLLFSWILMIFTIFGVQIGAHRLWAHRTYKANVGIRLFLALCHTMALQSDLYEWCRDHRSHHRFSDTDADPHNSNRGFFFSHMGWLMVKKHPEISRRGAEVSMEDLKQDKIVMFQRKYFHFLVGTFWGLLPTFIPVLLWKERIVTAFVFCVVSRYLITLHITWCVNSWAHMFGYRPYNSKIAPVEASIRHVLVGEGFHNYHHAFPWDYSASEFGPKDVFNPATLVINFFQYMGWAWDLRRANPSMVAHRIDMFGDENAKYKQNVCRTMIFEWTSGILVMTSPFWLMITTKYVYIYFIQQYMPKLGIDFNIVDF